MSFDEHTIPRWTKKFSIPKGYVTTRNKYMRCEKLYLGYEVNQRRFATIKATPGNVELRDVAGLLTRRVLRFGQPASLHAIFDAFASITNKVTVWRCMTSSSMRYRVATTSRVPIVVVPVSAEVRCK